MTMRELVMEVDREMGWPEERIQEAARFADTLMPEAIAFLDQQVPEGEIEARKQYILDMRNRASTMTLPDVMDKISKLRRSNN